MATNHEFKGSTWHKCDLHFHIASYDSSKNKSKTNQEIIDNFKSNNISVVAITDHHLIDTDRIFELYKIAKQENITVFPGIELRTDKGGSKSVHITGIFPEPLQKEDIEYIWNNLQSELKIHPRDIQNSGGDDKAYVNLEEAAKIIKKYNGIVAIHAGSKSNSIEEISNDELFKQCLKKDILDLIDILEIGKINDIEDYQNIVFPHISKNLPLIICSDCHDIDNYSLKSNCWIKLVPHFEGLKQIIHEPKYRVHIGEMPPQNPLHKIDKVSLNFPEDTSYLQTKESFCLSGKSELCFSPNLTCLIGGRGSGKSTILNLIHEKIQSGQNVFFKNNKLNIPSQLTIANCITIDDDENEEKYIEFLSQNEIESFALNSGKFTDAIYRRLIKLDNTDTIIELESGMKGLILGIDTLIVDIKTKYGIINDIESKEKELKSVIKILSSIETEDYKQIQRELSAINNEISEINHSKARYLNLIESVKQISSQFPKLDNTGSTINVYDIEYNKILEFISSITNAETKPIFEEIEAKKISLDTKLKENKEKLEKYLESQEISQENLKDISGANIKKDQLNLEIIKLKQDLEILNTKISKFSLEKIREQKEKFETELIKQIKPVSEKLENTNDINVKPIKLAYEFDYGIAKANIYNDILNSFGLRKNQTFEEYLSRNNYFTDKASKEDIIKELKKDESRTTITNFADIISEDEKFEVFKLLTYKHMLNVNSYKEIQVFYDGKRLNNTSFGQRCTAAIIILLELGNTPIIIDEPEAHLDSSLIASNLVDVLKRRKKDRQIIFATHNANFVINGDAELIHVLEVNENNITQTLPIAIESIEHRDKLLRLEGGEEAFKRRDKKYKVHCEI